MAEAIGLAVLSAATVGGTAVEVGATLGISAAAASAGASLIGGTILIGGLSVISSLTADPVRVAAQIWRPLLDRDQRLHVPA